MDRFSNKPRVFVSSTIIDFRDLRSALKYWLEEMGTEVRMSEFTDFERRPEQGTFDSCFNAITDCDYYILLVGGRRGNTYSDDVSVTQQEYRVAAELARQGKIKPVIFIRTDVSTALREISTTSSVLKDPDFVRTFIDEIQRTEIQRQGVGPAGMMWTYQFQNFQELVDALRVNLRLHRSIHRQALLANLKWEIQDNIARICTKHKGCPFPNTDWIAKVRHGYELTSKQVMEHLTFPREEAGNIVTFWMIVGNAQYLQSLALNQAIFSGEFLVYRQQTGDLVASHIYDLMQKLMTAIESCRSTSISLQNEPFTTRYTNAFAAVSNKEPAIDFFAFDIAFLFQLHDQLTNVMRLSVAILQYIADPQLPLVTPPLSPCSPLKDQIEKLRDERPTQADIEIWMSDAVIRLIMSGYGDISQADYEQFTTHYPEFAGELQKKGKQIVDQLVKNGKLGELFFS